MRAFKVSLNGKRLCLAGVGKEDGVLSTTVSYLPNREKDGARLHVGGLLLPQNEHVVWKQVILRPGDEVRLKIVDVETVDKPFRRYPRDAAAEARSEKRYVRKIAKKLGWKIQKGA